MKKAFAGLAGLVMATALAGAAMGESHADKAAMAAIEARHGHMELYAFNLGLLGEMAKGAVPYDAAAAKAAADNLAALSAMDQSRYWVEGTDEMSVETRAKVDIWDKMADFQSKEAALTEAAAAMAAVAGDGVEAVQAQIGAVGGACGGCHKPYRAPKD